MPTRFIDNNDSTVTDTTTGLMWQKEAAPGTYTWEDALKCCEALDLAGHKDWRLPDIHELHSIVDYTRHDPAIDLVFEVSPDWYWSTTIDSEMPKYVWCVGFTSGVVDNNRRDDMNSVRAVRG